MLGAHAAIHYFSYITLQQSTMPNSCVCCGHAKIKGDRVAMFRIPADKSRRQQWLDALNLTEDEVKDHTRVCSRHFLHGDSCNIPSLDLGKRFASPKKVYLERSSRAHKRQLQRSLSMSSHTTATSTSSRASSVGAPPTPGSSSRASSIDAPQNATDSEEPMSAAISQDLLSDREYSSFELPSERDDSYGESNTSLSGFSQG